MLLYLYGIISYINEIFTLLVIFPTIIAFGAYLTYKLRFFQIRQLKKSFNLLLHQKSSDVGNISHFEAISTVLAGNFGTGNISGMAVALATGGAGALVWMWIMIFFAVTVQYASCLLGVSYRQKNLAGEYVGGPMYYILHGAKKPWLAKIFAVTTIFSAISVGNLAQINSMTLPIIKLEFNPFICGVAIAALVGLVLLGGIKRIAKIASMIVPVMATLYVVFTCIILCFNYTEITAAFKIMYQQAFGFQAFAGGAIGATLFQAITTGFNRSIFATDAGTGIVPILQSSARTSSPVEDGLVTLIAPFIVMTVCTLTGLVLITTGAWIEPGLKSTNMVTHAFSVGLGHQMGEWVVMISLLLFGYTTILAWCFCAEKAVSFLMGEKFIKWFCYFFVALIPLGTLIDVDIIWALADICISTMLLINLIGILSLTKEVVKKSHKYFFTSTF